MEIDDPMAPEIFDQLTACDPGLAWELCRCVLPILIEVSCNEFSKRFCRNYVGYQLFGQEGIAVPFLDEAYHIVPFGVVAKKPPKVGTIPLSSLSKGNMSY